ncbi:hypothetical protein MAPG_10325 [Magnaporthiopsis poae ATCC 64411]|uniref:Glycosyl transferase n=1 Tax=Magnaporthiopsis poae (strain ATCC 64411 / 73-15) TaxID=644358 RepID=A0A0C4ECB0_MAGP6|nr:hypothetical protein MAPG_10325 [Magnaporthiopsis poae ATCC 64411]
MVVVPRRRLLTLWAVSTFVFITIYLSSDYLRSLWYNKVWPVVHEPALWVLGFTRYNFKPTPAEVQCFDGTVERHNAPGLTAHIPRVVHFVWGPKGEGAFNLLLYIAIRSALLTLQPDEVRVHYTNIDRDNEWFKLVEPNITLVHHDPKSYLGPFLDLDPESWGMAHMADVLRLTVLLEHGGIYLDADAFALRPFDKLLGGARDVIMGHEGGVRMGLTNAVILAKAGAPFLKRWLEMYQSFDKTLWNEHSVKLPRRLEDQYPNELCALSPTAFYWPMWTEGSVDWLHKPLNPDETAEVEETLRRNDGALFDDQLVLHAWSQPSRRYTHRLTPEIMRKENTRFNMVLRRFL